MRKYWDKDAPEEYNHILLEGGMNACIQNPQVKSNLYLFLSLG